MSQRAKCYASDSREIARGQEGSTQEGRMPRSEPASVQRQLIGVGPLSAESPQPIRTTPSHELSPAPTWQEPVKHPVQFPFVYESDRVALLLSPASSFACAVGEMVSVWHNDSTQCPLEENGSQQVPDRPNSLRSTAICMALHLYQPLAPV